MKRAINAVVRIEYDDNGTSPINGNKLMEESAIGLTIRPNFNTVDFGISIDAVHIESVDENQLVDWDKVKHNPEYLFTKQ